MHFRVVDGREAAGTAGAQAAWYFAGERVAVPDRDAAGFAPHTRPLHDLRRWNEAHVGLAPHERPPLVWVGDVERLRGARLAGDGCSFAWAGRASSLRFAERIPSNTAWFDAASAAFFAGREASLRGRWDGSAFVASALWPDDWRLGPQPPPRLALPPTGTAGAALRAWMQAPPARDATYACASVWQRRDDASWAGKPLVAFIVNGAQGDDDEAHGGHFSIATGRVADDGDLGAWLVDSFYSLDVVSEKGILPAPVPLDRYQGDLNSGQGWYRPSWAVVAVLDDERAAVRVQSALGRVFRHFWRGQLPYYHPTDNCTSIAVDTLRVLGLDVPLAGPSASLRAWLALPWLFARERSLAKAKSAYDYLVTERTRLLPALALEGVMEALHALAEQPATAAGPLAREFARDLAGIAWLRLPQFPSSRAWGAAPAVSLADYRARVPVDPKLRQIIPLPPRVLPEALREDDLLPPLPHPSDLAVRWWTIAPLAVVALILAFRAG